MSFIILKLIGGINIKDESLGIDWHIPVEKAILSEKDLKHACLKDAVQMINYTNNQNELSCH